MSKITRKNKILKNVFGCLSILCMFGPVIFFGIHAIAQGIEVGESSSVHMTFLILMSGFSAILSIVGVLKKHVFRSIPYFMILGIYFLVTSIIPVVLAMAICTICDELIFTPLHKHFAEKYRINKEIDKRV